MFPFIRSALGFIGIRLLTSIHMLILVHSFHLHPYRSVLQGQCVLSRCVDVLQMYSNYVFNLDVILSVVADSE